MDLSAEMSRIPFEELLKKQPKGTKEEDSAAIRSRVENVAEDSGAALRGDSPTALTGILIPPGCRNTAPLARREEKLLEGMYQKFSLTAELSPAFESGPDPGRYG